jgi:hypothetical protein
MKKLFLIFTIGLLSSMSAFAADSNNESQRIIHIKGFVQFWERNCATDKCDVPKPFSKRIAVEGELAEPNVGQGLNFFRTKVVDPNTGFTVDMSFYWRVGEPKNYLVAQMEMEEDGEPRASCNQYHPDTYNQFFPAGFCSTWITSKRQLGVSFYKY